MKQKMSITVEEETVNEIEERLKDGSFRNKSHFIEFALNKYLKEGKMKK